MANKYLDQGGVEHLWSKIKSWVNTQLSGKANSSHTHTYSQITNLSTWKTNTFGSGSITATNGVQFTSGKIAIYPTRYIWFFQQSQANITNFGLGAMYVVFCLADNNGQITINISGARQRITYTAVSSVCKRGSISISNGSGSQTVGGFNSDDIVMVMLFG